MITSIHNAKIQQVRSLQARSRSRREAQAFVIEGVRLAEEALQGNWPAQLVLFTEELSERGQSVVNGYAERGAPVEQVSPPVMRAASDTQNPQGILVVLPMRSLPLPENPGFIFIPDVVRDPGNLGTMLRTAAAAGVEGVLLPPGSVDPFSPKVVRAAMGAHFHLTIHSSGWEGIRATLKNAALRVYLASVGAGLVYTQADFRSPLALIIGGEAEGAGPESQALADEQIHIPMPGRAESLNAAVAAAILLFEVVRQRETPEGTQP